MKLWLINIIKKLDPSLKIITGSSMLQHTIDNVKHDQVIHMLCNNAVRLKRVYNMIRPLINQYDNMPWMVNNMIRPLTNLSNYTP